MIIFYYQDFVDLSDLIFVEKLYVTHIYISSIHFGTNTDGTKYIHLNNDDPYDITNIKMWNQTKILADRGVNICLMVGGAGGGYDVLFSDFEKYYGLLKDLIKHFPFINGIDLDIEEQVDINNVKMLIDKIYDDFSSSFIISLAPVQSDLMYDTPSIAGFIYKDLYLSSTGAKINHFNCQFYMDYSIQSYTQIINNGYPSNMIVMGMTSNMLNTETENTIMNVKNVYSSFAGVFTWELFNSLPNPYKWQLNIQNILNT